ncbi:MAG: methyltransferase [Kiritimatiellae bacterium]|nr:methyltransferase [Kiritimatiellia bacterium]
MSHVERFRATVDRKPVDRPCTWLGIPDPGAHRRLFEHFGVASLPELIEALDDDIVPIDLPYHSPTADAVYAAFDFAQKGRVPREHRTLNSPGFFEDRTDPNDADLFDWPDPANYISPDECERLVGRASAERVRLGVIWSAHFQDACAAFGMENALITLHTAPEMFRAVIDRIVEFYLQANAIFYAATEGQLHAVLIGNDFGGQQGLLLSPEMIREFALPGTRRLVEQAKGRGLTVIHHSCGSICEIIPDLIEIGVDVIHPIQALAKGMEPSVLRRDFGDRVAFCGGVDAQNLLVRGSPEQVEEAVRGLRLIFPTGLIISPSHEAILPDTPPRNVAALFKAARAKPAL